MRKAFKTSRLIGLLALLAGFMAFGASSAQAEGTWLLDGNPIGAAIAVQATAETHSTLLTKVGLSTVEILCPKIKFVNGKLEVGGLASGKIHFDECTTKLNGSTAAKCKPHSAGHPEGLIETNALDGSLRLHTGGIELFELLGAGGAPFVVLQLGIGECAIGNNISITGKFFLEDCKGEGLVDLVNHLFEEGPLSTLLFGGNPAIIHGSAIAFLPEPLLNHKWAGHV